MLAIYEDAEATTCNNSIKQKYRGLDLDQEIKEKYGHSLEHFIHM